MVAALSRRLDAEHAAEQDDVRAAVEALAASLAPRPGLSKSGHSKSSHSKYGHSEPSNSRSRHSK